MTSYDNLRKIIPADQALANEALSRSLRQVKKIFDTDLPTLSAAVSGLESNKDLPLINSLNNLIPSAVGNVITSTLATGTGPGNTLTTNDFIGTAAGVVHNDQLPILTNTVSTLETVGALDTLTANTGNASMGVYLVMADVLSGAYSNTDGVIYWVDIPGGYYGTGNYVAGTANAAIDLAFSTAGTGLIAVAANLIANIANTYPTEANTATSSMLAMAGELELNQNNCLAAGLEIGNIVNDIANANLTSNSTSAVLSFTTQLHDLGTEIEQGGAAQFLEQTANVSTLGGEAIVASMREGRNILALNAAGITLDTQLSSVNSNARPANNLSSGQYTVSEAVANIVI